MSIIVGNWKMNLSRTEAVQLARGCVRRLADSRAVVYVAPAAVHLAEVQAHLKGSRIQLGSQQSHWSNAGAFTGEVSLPMLADYGCTLALIGHSERRHVLGEPSAQTVKRALAVLQQSNFTLVYCVGETLEERQEGLTDQVIQQQLLPFIEGMSSSREPPCAAQRLVIAYEPVWAIGTGRVATLDQIDAVHRSITAYLGNHDLISPILYGGSVTSDNTADILTVPGVAGLLIGGASLDVEKFVRIVELSEQFEA